MMFTDKTPLNFYYVEIYEIEKEINTFRDEDCLISYLQNNDPALIGCLKLDDEDSIIVKNAFQDPGVATVGVSWDKYADALGLIRRQK